MQIYSYKQFYKNKTKQEKSQNGTDLQVLIQYLVYPPLA